MVNELRVLFFLFLFIIMHFCVFSSPPFFQLLDFYGQVVRSDNTTSISATASTGSNRVGNTIGQLQLGRCASFPYEAGNVPCVWNCETYSRRKNGWYYSWGQGLWICQQREVCFGYAGWRNQFWSWISINVCIGIFWRRKHIAPPHTDSKNCGSTSLCCYETCEVLLLFCVLICRQGESRCRSNFVQKLLRWTHKPVVLYRARGSINLISSAPFFESHDLILKLRDAFPRLPQWWMNPRDTWHIMIMPEFQLPRGARSVPALWTLFWALTFKFWSGSTLSVCWQTKQIKYFSMC